MKRNIQQIINELQHDSKIQAMHRANVAKRQALRERRRALMLARHHKAVMVYDDREAKKAAIKKAIWEKYNGSTLKARMMFIVKVAQGKYNEEFKELLDEACDEIDREKAEIRAEKVARELREARENMFERLAERLARNTGKDKADIVEDLRRYQKRGNEIGKRLAAEARAEYEMEMAELNRVA